MSLRMKSARDGYGPAVSLGVLPSVVYRIVAPDVLVPIVTVCAEVYVSATGLKVGVATIGWIV